MTDVPPVEQTPRASRFSTFVLLATGIAALLGTLITLLMGAMSFLAWALPVLAVVTLLPGVKRLQQARRPVLLGVVSCVMALIVMPFLIAVPFFALLVPQYVQVILLGRNVVLSAVSPNGEHEAYVIDEPVLDGPAHALYVQRKDHIHFFQIADLPEDVDAVEKIVWSPRSDIVVFQTRFALIAANVPGYEAVSIPLGKEWRRSSPGKYWTFTTGGPQRSVKEIDFPEEGLMRYRLSDSDLYHTVRMRDL